MAPLDPSSLATSAELCQTRHIDLKLTPSFDEHTIQGVATLSLAWQPAATAADRRSVRLDTRDLSVSKVELLGDDGAAKDDVSPAFRMGETVGDLGAPLIVEGLPEDVDSLRLRVVYSTSPAASGLQWLPAEQTDGKRHPYLFTQFQAIHARSCIPCQDSPSVKFTYGAEMRVPEALTARMSALETGRASETGAAVFSFEQKVPMTSYLVAFVVGDIVSAPIGPRSSVWTEKENLEACVYEFAETEQFIAAAEDILTPYVWGQYDLLVLPGSFPYGGMENPCLTFVTPTLLAGDRSQADVVAHEIAHSWSGNLVTNRTWEHFWLNEGFTVFIERKVAARVATAGLGEGAAARAKQIRGFKHLGGWTHLTEDVQLFMQSGERKFTPLIPQLGQEDPDDAFSSVPYERGSAFLFYLEATVAAGDELAFEGFLKAYVHKFSAIDADLDPAVAAERTLTSQDFRAFFLEYWGEGGAGASAVPSAPGSLSQVNWAAWFKQQGMPPLDCRSLFDGSMAEACSDLAKRWRARVAARRAGDEVKPAADEFSKDDMAGWVSEQKVVFLDRLLDAVEEDDQGGAAAGDGTGTPVGWTVQDLADLDAVYGLPSEGSFEIRFRCHRLSIQARATAKYPDLVKFVTGAGRMKFTRPLYRELFAAGEEGRSLAIETFTANRTRYHNICQKMVARDLGLGE